MKKYILIQNDGEIEQNSFELIGASTKRNSEGKIGFFGSGLKYSIAYMMRNNIHFRVFSGTNELMFTTIPEQLREDTFERICINGKPTSYTVTMGPTWTEDWFVLREIYCNALDESNCQLIKETENVNPSEGKTRIYIEVTDKLTSVINKWEAYFSSEREPIYSTERVYTSSLASKNYYQKCNIFNKTDGVLFRKGIRVYTNKDFLFDYDFDDVQINEDRKAKNTHGISYAFSYMIGKMIDERYVCSVLRTALDEKAKLEYTALTAYSPDEGFSNSWIDFSNRFLLVVKEKSGKYTEQIERSKREVLFIPNYFAKNLKKEIPQVEILGMGVMIGDVGMTEVDKTPKMDYLLNDVIKSLKEMKYEIPYSISVVQFDDDDILGQANIKTKEIFLSDRVFDMGRREIAMTLIEETEHIYSGKGDETRGFQTHLISSWLKTMEDSFGLFL